MGEELKAALDRITGTVLRGPVVLAAVIFAAALVAGNRVGWRVVSRRLDRERRIARTKRRTAGTD